MHTNWQYMRYGNIWNLFVFVEACIAFLIMFSHNLLLLTDFIGWCLLLGPEYIPPTREYRIV